MARRRLDKYYTPPPVTMALLERIETNEHFPHTTAAEPCAGAGWISQVLEEYQYGTITGEVEPEFDADHTVDVFARRANAIYNGVDSIITNPPFLGAPHYVRRFRSWSPAVACLLPVTFLEPCSTEEDSSRVDLLKGALSETIVFPRISFDRFGSGGAPRTVAWFLWDARPGPARLDFVDRVELEGYAGQLDLLIKETDLTDDPTATQLEFLDTA